MTEIAGAAVRPVRQHWRLIASDIDGTLLRSDGRMSVRTVEALAAAEDAGLLVVLCTGRPPRWMKPIAEATGHHGLAVCANGAIIYDLHTEEVVEEFPIDADVGRRLAEALRRAIPDLQFAVERSTGMLHEPAYVPLSAASTIETTFEELLTEPMVKLIARHPELTASELHAAAHEAIVDLADIATATFSGQRLLEISAAGVTKAFALERVAVEHGITPSEAVAFGDMVNDIPLLTWAGHSVAMGNAAPEVQAMAGEVTATNDDDGVALVV